MASKITDETIEYVGILAKLKLSGEEKEQAREDMQKMLDYIDKLDELDTTGVEPMSHIFPVHNVFREDVVTNEDRRTGSIRYQRRWNRVGKRRGSDEINCGTAFSQNEGRRDLGDGCCKCCSRRDKRER